MMKESQLNQIDDGAEKSIKQISGTTQLYRHFDADGELLYVGISLSAVSRLSQHKNFSHWHDDIRRIEIETFPDRKSAMDAEKKAIKTESPKHNILHQFQAEREKNPRVTDLTQKSRDLLEAKIVSFKPIYSIREAADLLDSGVTHITRLIDAGELGCIKWQAPYKDGVRDVVRITGWQLIDYMEGLSGVTV